MFFMFRIDGEKAAILLVVDGATNALTLPLEEMQEEIPQQSATVIELLTIFILNAGFLRDIQILRDLGTDVLLMNASLT